MNVLDKTIEAFSPEWAVRRQVARSLIRAYREADDIRASGYDGASRGRRTQHWHARGNSATAETRSALAILRNRARELVRNNAMAARAVDLYVNNCIGTGIRPSMPKHDELEDLFKDWAGRCDCDADGLHNLWGIQRLAKRAERESGEAFIVREWRPDLADIGQIPVQLRVLEGDYCDETLWRTRKNRNEIVQGVEFNQRGERVAYWLFDKHPGDTRSYNSPHPRRVPATEVIHWFDVLRPGQVRGVTPFAPVMLRMRDFESYEQAQLERQKIAACFTAFVRKNPDNLAPAVPTNGSSNSRLEPIGEELTPGIIEILAPGEDVSFADPPSIEDYKDFADVSHHDIAAGLGITYEGMTTNLANVNFSSFRAGWLEFQRKIDADRECVIKPRVLEEIASWVMQALALTGQANGDERVKWTPPRREMISPKEETGAAISQVRAGLSSLQEEIRKRGRDPDDVFNELAQDAERLDALKLILDSDPRHQNPNGTPRPETTSG